MTYDPYGPSGPNPRPDHYIDSYRDQSSMWGLGALAVLVLLGVMLWAFSGDNTNTARNTGSENTGAMTRSAPAPVPSTENTGAAPRAQP